MKIKYKTRKASEIRLQIAQKKKGKQKRGKFPNELRPKIDYISTIENHKRKKSFECQLNKRKSPKSTIKTQ